MFKKHIYNHQLEREVDQLYFNLKKREKKENLGHLNNFTLNDKLLIIIMIPK